MLVDKFEAELAFLRAKQKEDKHHDDIARQEQRQNQEQILQNQKELLHHAQLEQTWLETNQQCLNSLMRGQMELQNKSE